MTSCRHSVLLVITFLVGSVFFPGTSAAQLFLSHAELVYQGDETLSLFSRPDGGGHPFTKAHLPAGAGFADGTVVLTVLNAYNETPIVGLPAADMWIASDDHGMVACGGPALPDGPTDSDGKAFWVEPLFAGGHSETVCNVFVVAEIVPGPGLNLIFNSPDFSGDGLVNLQDGGHFASYLLGAYGHAADFNYDGVINLSDAGMMAVALGASCP